MIKVVALEDYLIDKIVELVQDYRKNVESGSVVGFDQPVADELSDTDVILAALRTTESPHQVNIAGHNTGAITF